MQIFNNLQDGLSTCRKKKVIIENLEFSDIIIEKEEEENSNNNLYDNSHYSIY